MNEKYIKRSYSYIAIRDTHRLSSSFELHGFPRVFIHKKEHCKYAFRVLSPFASFPGARRLPGRAIFFCVTALCGARARPMKNSKQHGDAI